MLCYTFHVFLKPTPPKPVHVRTNTQKVLLKFRYFELGNLREASDLPSTQTAASSRPGLGVVGASRTVLPQSGEQTDVASPRQASLGRAASRGSTLHLHNKRGLDAARACTLAGAPARACALAPARAVVFPPKDGFHTGTGRLANKGRKRFETKGPLLMLHRRVGYEQRPLPGGALQRTRRRYDSEKTCSPLVNSLYARTHRIQQCFAICRVSA